MTGTIRWYHSTPTTGEFQYDLGERKFDTEKQSIRDTIVELLLGDWEFFGEDGDTMIICTDGDDE